MKLKRSALAATAFSLVAVTAACGGGGADGGSGEGTYKWGLNAELSGVVSHYGTTLRDGIQAYVDEVNAAGGINGHKIELVALDNAGDASRAATNATQLTTADQVNAIFGHTLSAGCTAATPIVERYKVPLACISVAEADSDWVFSLGPNDVRAVSPALEAAKELAEVDTPRTAILTQTTVTGQLWADGVEDAADDAGVEIVERQDIDIAATDYSAQVSKVVASKPDVIVMTGTGPGFTSILKGLRSAGIKAPVAWVDLTGNVGSVAEVNDPAAYGFTTYQIVSAKATQGAAKDFVDAFGPTLDEVTDVSLNAGEGPIGYMVASAWGTALESCGYPCTGEELREELEGLKVSLPGLEEDYGYAEGDHYPFPNWYLYKLNGTEFEQVGSYAADDR